jgi:hypothetical protein
MSPPTSPSSSSPTTQSKKPLTARQTRKVDPSTSSKPCDRCQTLSNVLIRCQTRAFDGSIDDPNAGDGDGKWYLLCPGKCWMIASGGGVVDGSDEARKTGYRYGGSWKNKKGAFSAKKPKCKYNRPKKSSEAGVSEDEQESNPGEGRGDRRAPTDEE